MGLTFMIRLIFASLTVSVLAACATPPRDYVDPRPTPTVAQRAAFGVIGVAAAGVASPTRPNAPKSASDVDKAGVVAGGAAYGAVTGASGGFACGFLAIVCVPTFAVVGGAVGLGIGTGAALSYPTEEQINSADITLRNALLSVDVENKLVETIFAQASEDDSDNLRRVAYAIETNAWDLGDPDGEVDTRILIAASKIALVTPVDKADAPGADPPVRLEIVIEGKIFEDGREAPTFERRWRYDSEVHDYLEWADDQGVLVITELKRAIGVLSAQIVVDFLSGRYQSKHSLPVDEKVQANLAALDARPAEVRQRSEHSTAPSSPAMARSERKATKPRGLRIAVFPFASGALPNAYAESELVDHVHRFVGQQSRMELVYSAYDDAFDHSAVNAAGSFWTDDHVSKTPNEMNVYRAADALDADLVLTYFHQKRTAGWYSGDQYKFQLYVFDVQRRRVYRGTGDQHSVREVLESIVWQLETGRTAT
jgi:hypothetical protein